jgi:ABC-type oligopeptide transport system substrate-binding subunit
MKNCFTILTAAALTAALAFASCSKGSEGPQDPTPVISITTHPASPAAMTAGSISGSLSVAASVTESATLSYQ